MIVINRHVLLLCFYKLLLGGERARAKVQIFRREFHTYIHYTLRIRLE